MGGGRVWDRGRAVQTAAGASLGCLAECQWSCYYFRVASWKGPLKTDTTGTSLVVQWLRLHAPNAGGLGSIPGQGTRSHMLQLGSRTTCKRSLSTATNSRHAALKTQYSLNMTGTGQVVCTGARDEAPTPVQTDGGPGRPARGRRWADKTHSLTSRPLTWNYALRGGKVTSKTQAPTTPTAPSTVKSHTSIPRNGPKALKIPRLLTS